MRLPKTLKDLMDKTQNPKFFWNRSRICAPFLTWKLYEANSSKIWIESKQNKTNENQWHILLFYMFNIYQSYLK